MGALRDRAFGAHEERLAAGDDRASRGCVEALGDLPVAGLALGYPEAKEPLSARLSFSATVHTDRYDVDAVERELDAYDARRGKDWSRDKVRRYSKVMRGDFGRYVGRKRFGLG